MLVVTFPPLSLPSEDDVTPAAVVVVVGIVAVAAAAVPVPVPEPVPVPVPVPVLACLACSRSCCSLTVRSYTATSALYRLTSALAIFWYRSRSATPTSLHRLEISLPISRNDMRCFAREEPEVEVPLPLPVPPEDDGDALDSCSLRIRLRSSW